VSINAAMLLAGVLLLLGIASSKFSARLGVPVLVLFLSVGMLALWDRWSQRVEITSGELLPDQSVPLLKRRWELTREEALRLPPLPAKLTPLQNDHSNQGA
jgi:NhaP-type Na+/H+ or K+/H+ antiporter